MSLADLLLYLFFIAVTTIFMLFEAPKVPDRIRKVLGDNSREAPRRSPA
jgi:predicted PurR-regulated permease PerM